MATLILQRLQEITQAGAAARCRVALQPAGGEGTKVFPPTYAGAVYATEKRRLPGHPDPVDCVLLDSVQSQANRMEEALQQAIDSERFKNAGVTLPLVEVDFADFWDPDGKNEKLTPDTRLLEPVGKISSLQAPHRIVDAILRDSVVAEDNKPFRAKAEKDESTHGQRLRRVSAHNATALFELCPTALLLGMWDSTGPKGGLGAKFERAMVSEIVGINATFGTRTSSRIDPIIRKNPQLYETESGSWTALESEAVREGAKQQPKKYPKKLSELNLGNVTPDTGRYQTNNITNDNRQTVDPMREDGDYIAAGRVAPGGVTIEKAEQTIVLSFPALRRLRFPIDGNLDPKVDGAARTVLAALGLCAAALAAEAGLDLRSRCLLWPDAPLSWELLGKPGSKKEEIILEADPAIQLLKEAIDAAKALGLPWRENALDLIPSDKLVKLVVQSQKLALAHAGEGDE